MPLSIHVHVRVFNERDLLPRFMDHYGPFAERIFAYDDGSNDGSLEFMLGHRNVIATMEPVDEKYARFEAWKKYPCDWAVIVAADELLVSQHYNLRDALHLNAYNRKFSITGIGAEVIGSSFARVDLLNPRGVVRQRKYAPCAVYRGAVSRVDADGTTWDHAGNPVNNGTGLPTMYRLHLKYAAGVERAIARDAARLKYKNITPALAPESLREEFDTLSKLAAPIFPQQAVASQEPVQV